MYIYTGIFFGMKNIINNLANVFLIQHRYLHFSIIKNYLSIKDKAPSGLIIDFISERGISTL